MGSIVAIVGRPNVGKSTLFNRLHGERKAIIDDISGVTRDRIYGVADWNGKNFTVIDTGGFVHGSDEIFETAIRSQVEIAIEEATAIIFMVDVTTGITDLDEYVAGMLRKTKKSVFLAVNKVDNGQRMLQANEFWSLGFADTFFLSSITGSGTGELLDAVAEVVEDDPLIDPGIPKIAIVGQPNVGKSSLTNALLGESRNIVTDIAGTTRDSIHSEYNKFGKHFILIDTAGIRKKNRVHEDLEFYSVMRAIRAIEEADVCILMIDAVAGVEAQDLNIFGLIKQRNKGVVILVNKWDLVEKETNTARDMEATIKKKIAPFDDVPVIFTSVTEQQRIFKAIEAALEVQENRTRRIKTSVLNEFLEEATTKYAPPSHRGKFNSIKYVSQLPTYYPAFAFFCNHPKYMKDSYRNYLENQLREKFNFKGVPVGIYFREK
ncbi:MAG TPA: ribosome biogenesis GTPase Der [Saprospiraceae bacterium]|nr:ribosome biogenesis GTPase Der [Saprospiraceae bacterium]MCC6689568.1 ribosome biogenesis GTPase Der [Saprospiraceae bacterium]HMV24483.1 ribosome biogenesis GTPase Der [Saprospiraceae bacterium]HMW75438.1 ribosome biogenesis GTPase Der [Saprospiraceae bacterium]HMX83382.1 ribosome biogenesis GTPase Der [Saprospiraceae bacterium]